MGEGKEGEKETHYQVTRAPKADPVPLHRWDEAVLVQLEASKERAAHPNRTFPFPSLFLTSRSRQFNRRQTGMCGCAWQGLQLWECAQQSHFLCSSLSQATSSLPQQFPKYPPVDVHEILLAAQAQHVERGHGHHAGKQRGTG